MRLKLSLHHRPGQVLPINYQYFISSWIYKTLGNADSEYATRLHRHGYVFAGKKYKLFTFGPLHPNGYRIDPKAGTITLLNAPTVLELSFHLDEAVQHFVIGLFKNQGFYLGNRNTGGHFEVANIEMLPRPIFRPTMRFRLKTPLCISRNVEGKAHPQYMAPEEAEYTDFFFRNLLGKYQAARKRFAGMPEAASLAHSPFNFQLLSKPKSKLIHIKKSETRGYLFDFQITAPTELIEVGYFGGFGVSNSSGGMGMVEVVK